MTSKIRIIVSCGLVLNAVRVIFDQYGRVCCLEILKVGVKSGLIMRLRGSLSAVRIIRIYKENVFCSTCKASKIFEAFILFD